MSTFTKVVPGKVLNHGIISGETFPEVNVVQTSPAHFPDFAAITPKGKLKRNNVALSSFETAYGEVSDHYGLYYNPVTYAILQLRTAQQYSMGFTRLVNNYSRARVVWGISLFEDAKIPDYERDEEGNYKVDVNGDRVVKEEKLTGVFAIPGYLKIDPQFFGDTKDGITVKRNLTPQDVTVTTGTDDLAKDTKGKFYPFASFISGVGDYYNNMYAALGHSTNVDWSTIERFVKINGVYPFQMVIGETNSAGRNYDAYTQSGAAISNFTLFDTIDADSDIPYGLRTGLGYYTGANANRPIELTDSPFDSVEVYRQNIDTVCRKIYQAEYVNGDSTLPELQNTSKLPHYIANPIDLKNESGLPYKYVVMPEGAIAENNTQYCKFVGAQFGLANRMKASGGINPYLTVEGKYPEAPTDWDSDLYGEWVVDVSDEAQPSNYQLWTMNQDLIEDHYTNYLNSKNFRDVIRDRTSFIWDVGYRKSITNLFFKATEMRKDFIVVGCSTIYGGNNTTEVIYARSKNLHTKAIQYPESEDYNAPATRISINLWDSYYIDEPTFDKFSLNIDLMCAFAEAGGSSDGRIIKDSLPDRSKKAILRIAHTPSVDFEDDAPAAENLINGCITLRPCNMTQWKRPALPTVYSNTDSVLKDLPNVWYGVVIEKILQDQWILVSGQTMPAISYLSTVRDNADAQIHSLMGTCLSSWRVETEFRESEPNARSRMFSRVIYWVGKARYMMDAILEARNEEELDSEGTEG